MFVSINRNVVVMLFVEIVQKKQLENAQNAMRESKHLKKHVWEMSTYVLMEVEGQITTSYCTINCHFRYDNKGCGRSYLSQRDLEAHIAYRHKDKSLITPSSSTTTAATLPPLTLQSFFPAPGTAAVSTQYIINTCNTVNFSQLCLLTLLKHGHYLQPCKSYYIKYNSSIILMVSKHASFITCSYSFVKWQV